MSNNTLEVLDHVHLSEWLAEIKAGFSKIRDLTDRGYAESSLVKHYIWCAETELSRLTDYLSNIWEEDVPDDSKGSYGDVYKLLTKAQDT